MSTLAYPPRAVTSRASLLRNVDFRRLWLSAAVDAIGSGLTHLALPLFVLAVTGSAAAAGAVAGLRFAAYLLASIPGGMLADRLPRRRLLAIANAARMGCLLAVGTLVLVVDFWHPVLLITVAALLCAEMVGTAVAAPAESAALPRVVAPEQIPAAVSLGQIRVYVTSLAAPLLGGALFQVHPAVPFLLDAASYACALWLVLRIGTPLDADGSDAKPAGWRSGSRMGELTAGLRYILSVPLIRWLAGWAALVNYATAAITFGLVLVVAPAGSDRLGATMAGLAAAGLAGAAIAPLVIRKVSRPVVIAGSSAGMALLAAVVVVFPTPAVTAVCVAGICAHAPSLVIAVNSEILTSTPDAVMGRVQAALSLLASSLYPAASAVTGWLADRAAMQLAFAGPAVILAAVLISTLAASRRAWS